MAGRRHTAAAAAAVEAGMQGPTDQALAKSCSEKKKKKKPKVSLLRLKKVLAVFL